MKRGTRCTSLGCWRMFCRFQSGPPSYILVTRSEAPRVCVCVGADAPNIKQKRQDWRVEGYKEKKRIKYKGQAKQNNVRIMSGIDIAQRRKHIARLPTSGLFIIKRVPFVRDRWTTVEQPPVLNGSSYTHTHTHVGCDRFHIFVESMYTKFMGDERRK